MRTMLYFALDYAARGWSVFPCNSHTKRPLLSRDKDAAGNEIPGTGGLKKATKKPSLIEEWWQRWPNAMIGVACGSASGVWAVDPDAPKNPGDPDGRANWATLVLRHGCPHTHTHVTPGGGQHLVFKWRADRPVTNSEGNITGNGINVRGEGGYIIAAHSRRHDGKTYEIAEPLDFFNFADAPDWLYEMLQPKPRPQSTFRRSTFSARGQGPIARVQGILNRVAGTTEGDRNKILFWGAMRVVDMVVIERALPPSEGDRAFSALADAAAHAGLSHREIVRTLQSARARA